MQSSEILSRLEEFVVLLELSDANPFKIRAYQNGIRAIENAGVDLNELIESKRLSEIKGIGKGLIAHITALYQDEADAEYDALKSDTPPGLLDLLKIPGLGAKKVKAIYTNLGISTLGELEYACAENRLAGMKGFGEKSQANVLTGIEFLKQRQGLHLYPFAADKARALHEAIKGIPGITRSDIAGSLRRRREIVRDINLLALCAPEQRDSVMAAFAALPMVAEVISKGEQLSSVRLKSGLSAELHLCDESEYPHLLRHLTGSSEHNAALGALALEQGYELSERGLSQDGKPVSIATESSIYQALGLDYIPPELRENLGELKSAAQGELPELVADQDIRGLFHAHTLWSDGDCSLEDMVTRCRELGYSYLGVSDHSQAAVYAHGLEVDRVKAQWREIDELNQKLTDFRVFKGIEVDILGDGSLDYEDDLLEGFDFVIASVHSRFKMEKDEMTERILRAARHPAVTMLGHLTGRLLLAREGYPVDVKAVIDACVESNTVIELNAHPSRLDLDWRFGAYAREKGLKISINPDAHSIQGLETMTYGVAAARKGGFTPEQVVNTLPLPEISEWLSTRKQPH